jgi:predicted nucleic acid-binding protein
MEEGAGRVGILIDASVLIEAERGSLDIAKLVKGREDESFYLSVITASELLHGVWRAKDAKTRSKRAAFVESILSQFPMLTIDLTTARIHAQLWAELESKGHPIGPHDTWLAAACIAHGLVLATGNVSDFQKVPGLQVERWTGYK